MTDRLYRSRQDRMLTGVAGGVAEAVDADPSLIRIVWAVLVFLTGGLALLVYIVMAIVVPERPEGMPLPSATASVPPNPGDIPQGSWVAPDGSTVPMAASAASAASTAPGRPSHRDPTDRTRADLIVGLVLILLGSFFLVRQFVPSIDLGLWWPVVAIGLGVLLIVLTLVPSRHPD